MKIRDRRRTETVIDVKKSGINFNAKCVMK